MCVLVRGEHPVLRITDAAFGFGCLSAELPFRRIIVSGFGRFRVARIRSSVSPARGLARRSSVASQDQDQEWRGLRLLTSCRTIKPNSALKRTVRMKLLAKIFHLGPHGRLA